MKNIKTFTIAAISIIAISTLAACSSNPPEANTTDVKVYNAALNEDTSTKGKIVKIENAKIKYAKAFSQNIISYDIDEERGISYVPNDAKDLKKLEGKTVYFKINKGSSVFGIAIVTGDVVK